MRRLVPATALAAVAGAVFPAAASAHGLVGKRDLPIPDELFAAAAATVLIVSFVGLAALWPKPRLHPEPARHWFRMPVAVDVVCGVIGVGVFAGVVYAGLSGVQDAAGNILPTFVFVAFWVALAFLSLLFGNLFGAFNPWRAVARAVSWVAQRVAGEGGLPEPLPYPSWLGRWPAWLGILGFAWLELVYSGRDDPTTLATLALVYAAVQLVGMSLFGIEKWTERGDAFAVYFWLFSCLSAFERRGREVWVRTPLSGLFNIEPLPGTVLLVCTMIGSTSFDGFSQGELWNSIAPDLQKAFVDLGFGLDTALELAFTIGLLGMVTIVTGIYWLGVRGMQLVVAKRPSLFLARRFAISLVPIALAYVIAHYFSSLAYQGQAFVALVSDPLGHGSNLIGTASITVNYGWITAKGIWWVQLGALVVGHVAGLAVAHDRAVGDYEDVKVATRSQLWMLGVMVSFTCLGLWILSAAAQGG